MTDQSDIAPEKRRGTQAGDQGRPLTPEELSLAIHKEEKRKAGGVNKHSPASQRSLLFNARRAGFTEWLKQHGAVILDPTTQWETLRYTAPASGLHKPKKGRRITHIIYRTKEGQITFTADSSLHFSLYVSKLPIPDYLTSEPVLSAHEERVKRRTKNQRIREQLYERDGFDCWFCHQPLNGDTTIEHLLAKHNGGTDDLENLMLAHAECNRRAGHKSVEEKQAIRKFYKDGLTTDVKHWKATSRSGVAVSEDVVSETYRVTARHTTGPVCTYLTSEPSLERARAKANELWAAVDVVEVDLFAERTVRLARKRR